jgi:spiro-SPASM protein
LYLKAAAVLHVSEHLNNGDLRFRGLYLPDELAARLGTIPEISSVILAVPAGFDSGGPGSIPVRVIGQETEVEFWKAFFAETDFDHAVQVYADSPFLDPAIIKEMLDIHLKYLPEYTYSENVPPGYGSQIISRELISSIPENEKKPLPLAQVIKSNIHHFDVEIYYSHPDVRDKRISFRCGDPRDRIIMENIFDGLGRVPLYAEIKDVIAVSPEVLHIAPSYVEVELTGRCDLDCIFCYRKYLKKTHGDMELPVYLRILQDMRAFNLPYGVCLGGSGEPLMHGNFYEIMDMTLAEKNVKTLVVETNGLLADANFADYCGKDGAGKIRVIVNVNGMDGETYGALHGADHFRKVLSNVESLKRAMGERDSLYVQVMKINETEKFLDAYYDFWEKTGVPVILQKQNTYLGRITDRRYSDLSPVERIPCWHLQRGLSILHDGTVAFCKQDVDGEQGRGTIASASLADIWRSARECFADDYRGRLAQKPDCKNCDEWYTFNL